MATGRALIRVCSKRDLSARGRTLNGGIASGKPRYDQRDYREERRQGDRREGEGVVAVHVVLRGDEML